MKIKIGQIEPSARELIPPNKPDGSGIGVNYADEVLKAMGSTLEDGRKISGKRKGLKITVTVGEKSGEAIMNRFENGPDVENILNRAMKEAGKKAGVEIHLEEEGIFIEG